MQERPKILFIANQMPLPPDNGARQRALNISRLLGRFGEVSFVIVQRRAAEAAILRLNTQEFEVRMALLAARETLGRFSSIQRRILRELDPNCFATDDYAISGADRAKLLEEIQKHDLIWVQDVSTADSCRIGRWPHSVLDTVDVLSNWYRSVARKEDDPLRRLLDYRLSWIWKRRERTFTERFDIVTVCSEEERKLWGGHPRVRVIPNGFNAQPVRLAPDSGPARIGFIGTFEWPPNRDGVEWFARRAWPLIGRELPGLQLRVVGRNTNDAGKLGPNIAGLGWLEDPGEEIATWSAMIVPIRFGAGTRVKMAEGFARKCPIVATSVGAFGFGVRDGEEFLLADNARDFASACVRLVSNPGLGKALAARAHQRFLREWTWESLEGSVRGVVGEFLAGDGSLRHREAACAPVGASRMQPELTD